jgi:DNA-binding transcriptional LysR family regulator
LDDGQLVDLFPDWPDKKFTLYALYPSRHLPAAKVRAFIDFVVAFVALRSNDGRGPRSAKHSG